MITLANPTEEVIAQVEIKAREWITDFIAFSAELDGHQKSRVTPYMHIMAYHVPEMMKKYGNVRQFSGQGHFFMYMYMYSYLVYCRCREEQ